MNKIIKNHYKEGSKCLYWKKGHLVMQCRYCDKINCDYCKERFGEKENNNEN